MVEPQIMGDAVDSSKRLMTEARFKKVGVQAERDGAAHKRLRRRS